MIHWEKAERAVGSGRRVDNLIAIQVLDGSKSAAR